jgi:hypothetical protein
MPIHHLSREKRLIDPSFVESFKNLMLRHGALGSGDLSIPPLTDEEKFEIIPLVFGYMPEKAVRDRPFDFRVKPIIREHLASIGLAADEELVDIVKAICDQFYSTSPTTRIRKKFSINDIRAGRMHTVLLRRQNYRCAMCGLDFRESGGETLDHVIPWRIVGDVRDGSNWQILCAECNTGKSSMISHLLMAESRNWAYGTYDGDGVDNHNNKLRFAVLSRDGQCMHSGCKIGPMEGHLSVARIINTGMRLYDHYSTRCVLHRIE